MDDGLGNFDIVLGHEDSLSVRTAKILTFEEYSVIEKGKTFAFKVRVANENGWSEFSDLTYIKAAVVPARPLPPELISATTTAITLKFFKPEDNGGSEVTLFELYINDGDPETEPTTRVTTYTDNSLSHVLTDVDDNLILGAVYKFMFRAYNSVGNSEDSNIVQYALVAVPDTPDAPTGLFSLTSNEQIAVQWSAVTTTQSPGQDITGYKLEVMNTETTHGNYVTAFDGQMNCFGMC
jgi:hypothetical protein